MHSSRTPVTDPLTPSRCASVGATACLALAIACSTGDARPAPISVESDSAGITIVESGSGSSAGLAQWSLSEVPLAVIGADEMGFGFMSFLAVEPMRFVVGEPIPPREGGGGGEGR